MKSYLNSKKKIENLQTDIVNYELSDSLNQMKNSNIKNLITSSVPSDINNKELDNNLSSLDLKCEGDRILQFVKTELDSIDSESMLENFVKIFNSIQEDISKKFENSKYHSKIQEIFEKNFDIIINYFIRCLQHTDSVKTSVKEYLSNEFQNLNQNLLNEFKNVRTKYSNLTPGSSGFIYDEEFVALINSLSGAIKEFMKNSKNCIKTLTQCWDCTVDQITSCKGCLSDVLQHLNSNINSSSTNSKISHKSSAGSVNDNSQMKIIKDKIDSIIANIEEINTVRINSAKNIKYIDNYSTKFYEDAKVIFKKLKYLHNEKLTEIQKQNDEYYTNSVKPSMDNFVKINHKSNSVKPSMDKFVKINHNANLNSRNIPTRGSLSKSSYSYSVDKIPKKRIDSVSPAHKRILTNMSINMKNSGNSFMNSTNSQSKSGSNARSTDNKIRQNNSNSFNSCNDIVNVNVKMEELKTRNKELLEEIAKLHETYIHTHYDNLELKKNYDNLKNRLEVEESRDKSQNNVLKSKSRIPRNDVNISNTDNNYSSINDPNIMLNKHDNTANCSNLNKNVQSSPILNDDSLYKISEMVISFINTMSCLQDAISKKASNIKQMKKDFEMNKKELLQFASEILNNKNSNNNEYDLGTNTGENEIFVEDNSSININKLNSNNSNTANKIIEQLSLNYNLEKEKFLVEINLKNDQIINLNEEIEYLKDDIIKLNDDNKNLNKEMSNLIEKNDLFSMSIKKYEDENKKCIKEINHLKNSLELNIKDNKKSKFEYEQLLEKLNSINSKNEEMKLNLKRLEEENAILNQFNKEKRNLEISNMKNLQKEITDTNEHLKKLKEEEIVSQSKIDFMNLELNKKTTFINKLEEENKNLLKENLVLNSKISSTSKNVVEFQSLKDEIKDLKKELKAEKCISEESLNSVKIIKIENDAMNKELNELKELKSKYAMDKSSLEESFKSFKTKNEELIKDLRLKIKNFSEENSQYKENLKSLKNKNEELNLKLKNEKSGLEENLKIQISKNEDLESKISELKKSLNNSTSTLNDSVNKYKNEIETLCNKKLEQKSQIFSEIIESQKIEIKNLNENNLKSISEKNEIIQELQTKIKSHKDQIALKDHELSLMARDIKRVNEESISKDERITLLESDNISKENEFNKKLTKYKENLTIKETELNDIKDKYTYLLTNSNDNHNTIIMPDIETLKTQVIELEKKLKLKIYDLDKSHKEYKNLSQKLKTLFNSVDKIFKQSYDIRQKSRRSNSDLKGAKNINEAFLFEDEDINIKEDGEDGDLNEYSLEQKNFNLINEILQLFTMLSSKKQNNNTNITSTHQIIAVKEMKLNELMDENKRLKCLFDDCIQNIYDAIKSWAPHLLDELNPESDNKVIDSNNTPVTTSNKSDRDFIQKAVELFKHYNNEINEENTKLKKSLQESECSVRRYKIMAEEYKSALDLAITRVDHSNANNEQNPNQSSQNILITYPNSNYTFTKENVNNFTVDELNADPNAIEEVSVNKEINSSNTRTNQMETQINGNLFEKIKTVSYRTDDAGREKEMKNLLNIQEDLMHKLSLKEEELSSYKDACNKLLKISSTGGKSIPKEKYEILLEHFSNEQEKLADLSIKYEVLKRDYEVLISRLNSIDGGYSAKTGNTDNTNNKLPGLVPMNLTGVKINPDYSLEDNQLDDEEDDYGNYAGKVNNTICEKNKNVGNITVERGLNKSVMNGKSNANFLSLLNPTNNKDNSERLNTQNSIVSKLTDNTAIQEAIQEAIIKHEENEKLLIDQLSTIKEELRETRQNRDFYKKKLDDSTKLFDGQKIEILTMIKQAVEKLILEINLTPKIKEILIVIMRILDYNEEEINYLLKDKKKNFFTFFKKV